MEESQADEITSGSTQVQSEPQEEVNQEETSQAGETGEDGKTLIAYFSWSGNTEKVANMIQQETDGDLFEITPAEPYTEDYDALLELAQQEQTRPELAGQVDNWEDYDVVFMGYPNWWGTTPPVVNTFLNAHDFNGKTVIPFCTSGGSGISGSLANINQHCAGATILRGINATGDSADSIRSWLSSIGIIQ